MSRTVLIAVVAALLGGTVVEAQEAATRDRPNRPERPDRPVRPQRPGEGLPPGAGNKLPPGYPGSIGGPAVQPPRPPRPPVVVQPPRPPRPEIQPPRPGNGGPQIQPPRPPVIVQPPRPPRPPRPPYGGGNWNRPPVYAPGWYYPRGYAYRRWVAGAVLTSIYLSNRYYYTDYATLGLRKPPKGYRWVRYGPDLLLVRRKNGRIKEVYYNVFRYR